MTSSFTPLTFDIADLPDVFADMKPVPQADGPTAVCRIDYPPRFVQAYNYFRALLVVVDGPPPEYSLRALRLTELCLEQNAANYTVWHYRRLCLYAQPEWKTSAATDLLTADLELAARLGGANPKNYQIWYHRRAILQEYHSSTTRQPAATAATQDATDVFLSLATKELNYVATVLQADGKNYHAWTHRQWLLTTVKDDDATWKRELTYTAELIEQDLRNNSAWNQRWFVTHRGVSGTRTTSTSSSIIPWDESTAEMQFALEKATRDTFNESPLNYFIAWAKELRQTYPEQFQTELLPALVEQLQALDTNDDETASPNVLATRVELSSWQGDMDTARAVLHRLAESVDPIRRKYWNLRQEQLDEVQATAAS